MEHGIESIEQEDHSGRTPQGEDTLAASSALAEGQPAAVRWRPPLATWKGMLLCFLAVLVVGAGALVAVIKLQASPVPSGREKWSRQVGPLWHSSVAVSNGIAYIGTLENKIFALDAASGQVIWSIQLGHYTDFYASVQSGIVPSPVVSNGVVYSNSQDDFLYALDALTGRTIWSFQVYGGDMAAPTVVNGIAYIGSEGGVLYALDAASGRKLWSYQTLDFLDVPPAVANGLVYVDGAGNALYALNAVSGRKQWVGGVGTYTPTIANGLVYVTGVDGELYVFDANSGKEQWYFTFSGGFNCSPIVVGKTIYIYSYAGLLAVDASTHRERWFHQMNGTFATPVVVKNTIYVTAGDRNWKPSKYSLDLGPNTQELDVFDATSGTDLWYYPLGGLAFSTPAVSNGVAYVGGGDGKLYALLPPG